MVTIMVITFRLVVFSDLITFVITNIDEIYIHKEQLILTLKTKILGFVKGLLIVVSAHSILALVY